MAGGTIGRALRRLQRLGSRPAMRLVAHADAVRAQGHHRAAAILYAEAARLAPRWPAIHVQAGHMFKEAGAFAEAERHYLAARARMPVDDDLALQLGHFYKVADRLDEAETEYRRALALRPEWADPQIELDDVRRRRGGIVERGGAGNDAEGAPLALEALPGASRRPALPAVEAVRVHRLGRPERSVHGILPTLRGVEAIRGLCVSAVPIAAVDVILDGTPLGREAVAGGYPLATGNDASGLRKYVFNLWLDFAGVAAGHRQLELRCLGADGAARSFRASVMVAAPLREARYPGSDALVEIDPQDPRPVGEQVDARPSMIRPATRALTAEPPRTVLVQRIDQLGDLIVSVPALRRLREILPGARIVGLLSPGNVALARTLGLFDAIEVASFPEDAGERRRVMTRAAQEELRARLAPYDFDLAIDLLLDGSSRPLLRLSGAALRYGFGSRGDPALDAGVDGFVHDRLNGEEALPHSSRLVAMVDWLAATLTSQAQVVRRAGLGRDRLARFGLGEDARYVVLHTGSRLGFNRWPGFADLAALILARTDLVVVMMADDADMLAALPAEIAGSARLRRIGGQLDFDDFDALLSFCAVMVGNDSGPKQLAALRGARVVSLHMARTNWNEWGQEGAGFIISRRVPCAGCAIHHQPEECGRDFACLTRISAEEVFGAVAALL